MAANAATPRILVVIVNYQSYEELHTCLTSLGRACPDCPVVVVDHASDAHAADQVSSAFRHVRIVRVQENAGFAAGVNRGARETASEYLLLVNPDCVVEPHACDLLSEWMDQHQEVAIAGPRIRDADGTIQASARRFPNFTTGFAGRSSWLTRVLPSNPLSRHNLAASQAENPIFVDWVSGACMMVRRRAFDAVGGMDEGFFLYWEDADLCRRLERAGWRTVYFPAASVTHIGGRSSRHAADASLVAFHRSAFRLFWKHATVAGRLFAPMVFVGLRARLAFMRHVVRRRARERAA